MANCEEIQAGHAQRKGKGRERKGIGKMKKLKC